MAAMVTNVFNVHGYRGCYRHIDQMKRMKRKITTWLDAHLS